MSDAATNAAQPPRLVGLYQDHYDDAGNRVGWEVIGWGVVFPDWSAVTVPISGKVVSASVWRTLDDALRALDAQVCDVNPRPYAKWWRQQ